MEPDLPAPLDRQEALRVLHLPPAADAPAIKRAYRRLARARHPDVGGDVHTFRELQRAYEILIGDAEVEGASAPPGRPSRARDDWSSAQTGQARPRPDATSVRWDAPLPDQPTRLTRDLVACWLADGRGPGIRPLTATSRAPGSRLNGAATKLSTDLTASLAVRCDTDDRGHEVVAVEVAAGNRRGRRSLDDAPLDGGWVRRRTSSSTRVRWTAPPDDDLQVTAVRAADAVSALLERVGWPLSAWTLTTG